MCVGISVRVSLAIPELATTAEALSQSIIDKYARLNAISRRGDSARVISTAASNIAIGAKFRNPTNLTRGPC